MAFTQMLAASKEEMKRIIGSIILTIVFSCSSEQNQTKRENVPNQTEQTAYQEDEEVKTQEVDTMKIVNSSFRNYVNSLDQIPLPFTYSTFGDLPELSQNYDKTEFEKFKLSWTREPLGILYKNEFGIVTIECSVGDYGLAPMIAIYDLEGNKIDSLNPHGPGGIDMGYEAVSHVTLKEDRSIMTIDSIKRWDINEQRDDIVEGTMKLTVDTTIYRLTDEGAIVKE